jgi:MFS family permease
VADFDTTVTVIQGIITLYSLAMAALMITGGKIGDLVGRRRAFAIGLVIYACGSGLTAISWSVLTLGLGWSVLEGIGAALVLPALVALIAMNYEGADRIIAYAVIGGVAGVGIAVETNPRRLADHGIHLATGLRGRGSCVPGDPGLPSLHP